MHVASPRPNNYELSSDFMKAKAGESHTVSFKDLTGWWHSHFNQWQYCHSSPESSDV